MFQYMGLEVHFSPQIFQKPYVKFGSNLRVKFAFLPATGLF